MKAIQTILFSIIYILVHCQEAIPVEARCLDNSPTLKWQLGPQDLFLDQKENIILKRSKLNASKFEVIDAFCSLFPSQGIMYMMCIDSSLSEKGFYEYRLGGQVGRVAISTKQSLLAHNYTYLPNPRIVSFKATGVEGAKALELQWDINFHEGIKSLDLFRKGPFEEEFTFHASMDPWKAKFVDQIEVSNESYKYQLVVQDFFGGVYKSIKIHGVSNFEEKAYPPQDFIVDRNEQAIHLSWRKLGSQTLGYNIYRKLSTQSVFQLITDRIDTNDSFVHFVDRDELAFKDALVLYKVTAISDGFLESGFSETIAVQQSVPIPVTPPQEIILLEDSANIGLIWEGQFENEKIVAYKISGTLKDGTPKEITQLPPSQNYLSLEKNKYTQIHIQSKSVGGNFSKARTIKITKDVNFTAKDFDINKLEDGFEIICRSKTKPYTLQLFKSINFKTPEKIATLNHLNNSFVDTATSFEGSVQYLILNGNEKLVFESSPLINH